MEDRGQIRSADASAELHARPPIEAPSLSLLREIARDFGSRPFRPHPLLRGGHAQTLAGYAWPRRFRLRRHRHDEARLFEVEPGVKVLGHCRWQPLRESRPTLVVVHGLEGSSASVYVIEAAALAYRAGFNVVRLNQRNCGGTERLTPTLYHSGLWRDFARVLEELSTRDSLADIYLAGYSMSGNMVLRLAGELAGEASAHLAGVCAVSPPLDLSECAQAIDAPANWVYRRRFIASLRRRVRLKRRLFPDLYDARGLKGVRTIREFDERYTAPHAGFRDAEDYYRQTSSLPLVPRIRVPTLVVHAKDDPLVPLTEEAEQALRANPHVILVAPPRGGHVAFVGAGRDTRFWAEGLLVEFCRRLEESRGGPGARASRLRAADEPQ